ncbi:MAG: nicotinate-nucleotide adenylyltransferase [bacterium]|nr:nicotinate-nucleotide adenylyltransferase [bacterium]
MPKFRIPDPRIPKLKRVGLFGGTFDPIHYGHLRAAEEARLLLPLDQVIFVPAALPPHKQGEPLSDPRHRLEMVERAVADNVYFSVSDVEIACLEKPSYTVQTVEYFLSRLSVELYCLMGLDSFREIETWKEYRRLLELCRVVVVTRPGLPGGGRVSCPPKLKPLFSSSLRDLDDPGKRIFILPVTGFEVSSTQIRSRARAGQSIRYLLPQEVEEYIEENGLYKSSGFKVQGSK